MSSIRFAGSKRARLPRIFVDLVPLSQQDGSQRCYEEKRSSARSEVGVNIPHASFPLWGEDAKPRLIRSRGPRRSAADKTKASSALPWRTGGRHKGVAVAHDRGGLRKGDFRYNKMSVSSNRQQQHSRVLTAEQGGGGERFDREQGPAVTAAQPVYTTT